MSSEQQVESGETTTTGQDVTLPIAQETQQEKPLSKLYLAVKENDAEKVAELLASGEDANIRGMDGQTLLHLAVTVNAADSIFTSLLDKVDDFTQRDENGNSVLEFIYANDYSTEAEDAIKTKVQRLFLEGDIDKIRKLVLSGWNMFPVTSDEVKDTSEEVADFVERLPVYKEQIATVHKAIEEGDTEVTKLLQENPELCAAYDRTGLPPLTKAVIFGKSELVKEIAELYKCTTSLDVKDNLGRVALHYAASTKDDGQLYEVLLDAGANDITDKQGHTASNYKETPELLDMEKVRQRVSEILSKSPITERLKPHDKVHDEGQGQTEVTEQTEVQGQTEVKEQAEAQGQTEVKEQAETQGQTEVKEQAEAQDQTEVKETEPVPVHESISRQSGETQVSEAKNKARTFQNKSVNKSPTTFEGQYLANTLGSALTLALAEIAECRPWDPIEYLAHFLYKFHKNMDHEQHERNLKQEILDDEADRENQKLMKQREKEEQQEILKEKARRLKEEREEQERQRQELEEQQKRAKEASLSQPPDLPTVKEETGEVEFRGKEKDENGQTELHRLAAQEGADLLTLLNLGYSLADRDEEYRTPRDIAEQKGLTENVEIMDNYIANMLEGEKLQELETLLLEGYDKFSVVLSNVSTEGLPEDVTDFISATPELQMKVKDMIKAVRSGVVRDVRQTLDRKRFAVAKDNFGRSPLHNAILYDHPEVTEYIVQSFPVSLKTRDNMNRTALHYAAALSDDLFDLLTEQGADQTVKDVRGKIPGDYKDDKGEIIKLRDDAPGTDVNGVEKTEDDENKTQGSNENDPDNNENEADNNDNEADNNDADNNEATDNNENVDNNDVTETNEQQQSQET